MIVSEAFIFVHVPKTGGQSVTQALGGKSAGVSTHTPLRCVEKSGRFAFGFVRNPWSRMVSLYRFLCQKPFRRTDNFDQDRVRRIGFGAWLTEEEFFMQEDYLGHGEPWVMRDKWRGDGDTDLLPMQRRPQLWWVEGCDYIGHTEQLETGFRHVCQALGISGRLGHSNRTQGADYRAEYGDREAEFVAEWFKVDIDRFGYGF